MAAGPTGVYAGRRLNYNYGDRNESIRIERDDLAGQYRKGVLSGRRAIHSAGDPLFGRRKNPLARTPSRRYSGRKGKLQFLFPAGNLPHYQPSGIARVLRSEAVLLTNRKSIRETT